MLIKIHPWLIYISSLLALSCSGGNARDQNSKVGLAETAAQPTKAAESVDSMVQDEPRPSVQPKPSLSPIPSSSPSPMAREIVAATPSLKPSPTPSPTPVSSSKSTSNCATPTVPPKADLKLKTMIDIIGLINSLPKPLSLDCFIASLPRPFGLTGSSSAVSAQPAAGPDNPRLFIVYDSLIIGIALGGEAVNFLEMSELGEDQTRSVKGEIAFPVTESLGLLSAYERIMNPNANGTRCATSFCHSNEVKSFEAKYADKGFVSGSLRPGKGIAVSFVDILYLNHECADLSSYRCKVLRAIFSAQVIDQPLPQAMPTLFKD